MHYKEDGYIVPGAPTPVPTKPDTCPGCGRKVPLRYTTDPFYSDVYDEERWGWTCDECHTERAMEV